MYYTLFNCLCCFSEVSIKGVFFSTVLARRVLGGKFFYPPPKKIYENSTLSSPKRSISAILRILVGVGVSSVGKLSAIAGGVFGFLFLKRMLIRTSGDDGTFCHMSYMGCANCIMFVVVVLILL